MALTDRKAVELFHLLFVRRFLSGPEKGYCVIKGGCNLRFYFGSVRYSEDIDFDVAQIPTDKLKSNVDKVLSGPGFKRDLTANNLNIESVSTPKQTDTTQRWKVGFHQSARSSLLHTKIEFSRRDATGDSRLEAIDSHLIEHYRLSPILARHYLLPAALRQKVHALAHRATPQVRDVFDISVLLSRAGTEIQKIPSQATDIQAASARVLAMSYDEYVGQVVAYLHPDDAAAFDSPEAWEALQLQVITGLERMQV